MKGELYARLVFVLARDHLQEKVNLACDFFFYTTPFTVVDFLRSLFNSQHHTTLEEAVAQAERMPKNTVSEGISTQTKLGTAFKNSYLNFTHFTHTNQNLRPSNMESLLHGLMHAVFIVSRIRSPVLFPFRVCPNTFTLTRVPQQRLYTAPGMTYTILGRDSISECFQKLVLRYSVASRQNRETRELACLFACLLPQYGPNSYSIYDQILLITVSHIGPKKPSHITNLLRLYISCCAPKLEP